MMRNPRFPRGLGRPQSSPLVLQRRLTLDDFQLDHRPMDVPGNMEKARREKASRAEGIKNARAESGNLREYSRRQFQTVVDHESSLSPQQKTSPPPSSLRRAPPPPPLRPVTVSGYARQHTYVSSSVVPPSTPTNGPTKDGSVLYNGALESLRCRPKSEPAGRFDHLRRAYTNYPTIQRVLEQSNCEYRLVATPRKKVRDADKKEFIFIPASSPDFYSDMFDYDDVISSTPRDSRNEAWSTDPLALSVAAKDKVAGGEGHSEMESSTGSVEGRLVNG
nr:hypothetical protein BaRGS_023487 [Batillaria attramentaria]